MPRFTFRLYAKPYHAKGKGMVRSRFAKDAFDGNIGKEMTVNVLSRKTTGTLVGYFVSKDGRWVDLTIEHEDMQLEELLNADVESGFHVSHEEEDV